MKNKDEEEDRTEKLLQEIYDDALSALRRSERGTLEDLQNTALVTIARRNLTEYRKGRK